jgi:hypothetical protein
MSGLSLSLGRARRRSGRNPPPPFNPLTVTAVTEWYRNSTVGALTTYPALINPGSPGLPGVVGPTHQPTGNADLSVSFDGGDHIRIPLAAPNNGATVWGWWGWIKPSLSAQHTLYNAQPSSGASSTKARIDIMTNGSIQLVSATSGAAASSAGAFVANVAKFLLIEFNGARASGSRFKFFVDLVDVTASDSTPAALNAPTGNSELGAQDAGGGGTSYVGILGRSSGFLGSAAEAGSTVGILTSASRAGLRTVDPLA